MTSFELKHLVLLAIPFALIPSMMFIFASFSKWLGKEKGYLLSFLFYWIVWCLFVPTIMIGTKDFLSLFVDVTPLLSRQNWLVAVLFAFITLVTLFMYGKNFIHAPLSLIFIAIPAATINGICEELLWRGLYIKTFPHNFWLAILFPAFGFAFWHLIPLQIFSSGGKITFIVSTFFLGLAYGFIAYRTGSIQWTVISHSLNGTIALGGMIAPSMIRLIKNTAIYGDTNEQNSR